MLVQKYIYNEASKDDLEYDYIKFLNKNKNLLKIECIIIETRYTNRILDDKDMIFRLNPVVILTDQLWDPELEPYVQDNKIYELTMKITDDGVCVFKDDNSVNIFDYINKLDNESYCCISSIISIEWINIDGQLVLYIKLDTESG